MAITLDGNSIPLALVGLGITHNAASSMESYAALAESWRSQTEVEANGGTYATIPTEPALQAEADSYETDASSGYATRMKSDRLNLIKACDDLRSRHERQVNHESLDDTARIALGSGALSDTDYGLMMTYIKNLADLPANIVAGPAGTYGTFNNPTWPTKPSFVPTV